jgi:hypothetical protein
MGGTPFHMEIEAYSRLTGAEPDAWEVSMLRALYRLDMAAANKRSKSGPVNPTVEATDGAGIKGLMRGMGAKKR